MKKSLPAILCIVALCATLAMASCLIFISSSLAVIPEKKVGWGFTPQVETESDRVMYSGEISTLAARVDFAQTLQAGGISGYVRDGTTLAGIGGATVRLIRAGVLQVEMTTSVSGYYAFSNLAAGTYTLSVNASRYQTASHDLTLSDAGIVLDFYLSPIPPSTHQLSGFVYAHGTTNPIGGANVQVGDRSVVTDANGHYSMDLANGSYVLYVNASGYQTDTHKLTLYDSDIVLDFYLTPASARLSSVAFAVIIGAVAVVAGGVAWALTRSFGGRRAIKEDLAKTAPRELHKLTETPQDYHKLTVYPQDYHKLTELPQDYHKLTETPQDYHKLTETPQDYHKLTVSPQDYHKLTESPQEYHKLTESPQGLHKVTESPQTAGQTTPSLGEDQLSESIVKKKRRL